MEENTENEEQNYAYDSTYFLGLGFCFIVIVFFILAFLVGKEYFYDSDMLPINYVSVHGGNNTSIPEIVDVLKKSGELHNFIKLDVESVQNNIKTLPWIENVTIRKQWPSTLILNVKEKTADARWGEDHLFSRNSGIFSAPWQESFNDLVYLSGSDEFAELIYDNYLNFKQKLAIIGCEIKKISLSKRQSWTVELKNGPKLFLGRDNVSDNFMVDEMEPVSDVDVRMYRFVKAYPKIKNSELIDYIDLRYSNGFAIGWKISDK